MASEACGTAVAPPRVRTRVCPLCTSIMSWGPVTQLDPLRSSFRMQVMRILLRIGVKAALDGRLGREFARERDRERVLGELLQAGSRNALRATHSSFGEDRPPGGGECQNCRTASETARDFRNNWEQKRR